MADFRILVPLAVLLGLLSISPVARASHIQCGDVLTTSVKFDSDVLCTNVEEGDVALTIGASNITVDARGYRIVADDCCYGSAMQTSGAYSGVVIKHIGGTDGFTSDVYLQLSDSTLKSNRLDAQMSAVHIEGDRNLVKGNIIYTGYVGISMIGAGNRAVQNDVQAYEGEGILASGSGVRIANNNLRALGAIFGGIRLFGFTDAVVTGNHVSEFVFGIGLANGTGASVTRNYVHDNGYGGGIYISDDVSNVDLRRNTANANGGSDYSGIWVGSPSVTITRNTANDNGWYGIHAVPGVIDGGGNRASGNGNPAQCVEVRCR
ncbi:MAG TPA: right-handed parallel beta-helix repeat-containing protein [Solirubrobacterales bacterium]|nr:right-handed parallel beta-helix repeat-containing protein [Solirubrobacterales bacterium]